MIRYANDLKLTDLARTVTNQLAELNALLTSGSLERAFGVAEDMRAKLEDLQFRLNDIRFGKAK